MKLGVGRGREMLKQRDLPTKIKKAFKGDKHRGYFHRAQARPGHPDRHNPPSPSTCDHPQVIPGSADGRKIRQSPEQLSKGYGEAATEQIQ